MFVLLFFYFETILRSTKKIHDVLRFNFSYVPSFTLREVTVQVALGDGVCPITIPPCSQITVQEKCWNVKRLKFVWFLDDSNSNNIVRFEMQRRMTDWSTVFQEVTVKLIIFNRITPRIEPRKPRMDVNLKYELPALVNEFYELQLAVESLEDTPVKDLR